MRFRFNLRKALPAVITALLIFQALLSSCTLSPFNEGVQGSINHGDAPAEEKSSLFKKDESNGSFVLEVSDRKYLKDSGCTFWTSSFENESDGFSPLTVTAIKESGEKDAGFGTVFCIQEKDGKSFMLSFLINVQGLYSAGTIKDGTFSHINGGWKSCDWINRGWGVTNEISITHDEENARFIASINGHAVLSFSCPEGISFSGCRGGFAAVISGRENFPDNPVKIIFSRK